MGMPGMPKMPGGMSTKGGGLPNPADMTPEQIEEMTKSLPPGLGKMLGKGKLPGLGGGGFKGNSIMAVKLRLARHGAKKRPYYRIVAADVRAPRDGRFIEQVGAYNPMLPKDSEDRVKLDVEKVQAWLKWKAGNNPEKGKPGQKALERIEERKEKAEARAAAEAEAKEAAAEAKKAAEAAAKEAAEAPASEEPAAEA